MEKKAEMPGMYRVYDKSYPRIILDDFIICKQDEESVWIQKKDYEGAQFSNKLFEKAIQDFFEKNF